MLKLALLANFTVAAITACAPTTTQVAGPSGATMSTAKCSQSPNACLAAASRTCGGGSYQVLDSESHAGGLIADILPGPVPWYSMTYQCGSSDGVLPDFPFQGAPLMTSAEIAELGAMSEPPRTPIRTNCNRLGDYVNCTTY